MPGVASPVSRGWPAAPAVAALATGLGLAPSPTKRPSVAPATAAAPARANAVASLPATAPQLAEPEPAATAGSSQAGAAPPRGGSVRSQRGDGAAPRTDGLHRAGDRRGLRRCSARRDRQRVRSRRWLRRARAAVVRRVGVPCRRHMRVPDPETARAFYPEAARSPPTTEGLPSSAPWWSGHAMTAGRAALIGLLAWVVVGCKAQKTPSATTGRCHNNARGDTCGTTRQGQPMNLLRGQPARRRRLLRRGVRSRARIRGPGALQAPVVGCAAPDLSPARQRRRSHLALSSRARVLSDGSAVRRRVVRPDARLHGRQRLRRKATRVRSPAAPRA